MMRAACSHLSGGPMMWAIFSGPVPSSGASTQRAEGTAQTSQHGLCRAPGPASLWHWHPTVTQQSLLLRF